MLLLPYYSIQKKKGAIAMANAKQLPSGAWRVQYYDAEGKRKSITRDTKKEAEYAALEAQLKGKREAANITVGRAIDDYIASKDGVLSPTTIAGYQKIRRNNIQALMSVPLGKLNAKIVQQAFNAEAKRVNCRGNLPSPKTMANTRGLFSAAMAMHGLEFEPTIPAKRKQMRDLPAPAAVYEAVRGSAVELPCMLAMWLSFTMSEIRGLRVCDIKDGMVTINQVIVDVDGLPVAKAAAKEYERNRTLAVPPFLMRLIEQTEAWQKGEGYIVPTSGQTIRRRFERLCNKAGIDITFHDLRHINASVMLKLHVPDKYAMARGGWKTDATMKRVYQETFSAERDRVDQLIDNYFNEITASD